MRTLSSLLLMLAMAALVGGAAEARSRNKVAHGWRDHQASHARAWRQQRGSDFRDHLRAESCDAAGEYRGYPDWARAAFTCGRSR